jgi:hypothetical protein
VSWNSSLIAIKSDPDSSAASVGQELGLLLDEPVGPISWFDATSSLAPGTSVAAVDGWVVLCDPHAFFSVSEPTPPDGGLMWSPSVHEGLCRLSKSGVALGFIIGARPNNWINRSVQPAWLILFGSREHPVYSHRSTSELS